MKKNCIIVSLFLYFLSTPLLSSATLLDFEGLPDFDVVTNQYASQGVTFSNTIALTAGLSLNEIDFPPHSGLGVVGDDGNAPMEIFFTNPAQDISAWFTYATLLTLTAFDSSNTMLGAINSIGLDNTGYSTQIALGIGGVSHLVIAGDVNGGFTMDDLSFTSTVPEPATLSLMAIGLIGVAFRQKRTATACFGFLK